MLANAALDVALHDTDPSIKEIIQAILFGPIGIKRN